MSARLEAVRREMETGGNLPGFRRAVEAGDPRAAATILREMDLVPTGISLDPALPSDKLARNLCTLVIEHALNFVTYDEEMRDTVVRALVEAEDAATGAPPAPTAPVDGPLPTRMPDIDARDGSPHPDEPPVLPPHDPAHLATAEPPDQRRASVAAAAGDDPLFPPFAGRTIADGTRPRGAVDSRILLAALPPLPSPPSARPAAAATWITGRPWSQSGWGIDIPEAALGAEQAVELQNLHAQDPAGFLARMERTPFAEMDPAHAVRPPAETFKWISTLSGRAGRTVPAHLVAVFEDRLVGVLEEVYPERLAAMRQAGASLAPGAALEKVLQAAAGALARLHEELAVFGADRAAPDPHRLAFRQFHPGGPTDFNLLLDVAILDHLATEKTIVDALGDALGQAAFVLAYPQDRDMAAASPFLTAFDADPLQTLEALHGRAEFPRQARPAPSVEVVTKDEEDDPEP